MLVLTREVNEVVRISDDIEIAITEIDGKRVRLGITAPPEVEIWRSELQPGTTDKIPGCHRNNNDD